MKESVKLNLEFNIKSKANIDKVVDAIDSQLDKAVEKVEKTAEKTEEKIDDVTESTEKAAEKVDNVTESVDKVTEKINDTAEAAGKAAEKVNEVADAAEKIGEKSSASDLPKQLEEAKAQLDALDKSFEQLSEEQGKLAEKQATTGLSDEEQKRFEELDALIIKNGEDTDIATKRVNELTDAIDKMPLDGTGQNAVSGSVNELIEKFTDIREKASTLYLQAINNAGEFEGKLNVLNNRLITQTTNAQKLAQSLLDIANQEVVPQSIVKLQKELAKSEKELEKLDVEFEELAKEQESLANKRVVINGMSSLTPEEEARFVELDNLIIKNGNDTDALTEKIVSLKGKLEQVQLNPELTPEFQNLSSKLYITTSGIQSTTEQMDALKASAEETGPTMEELNNDFSAGNAALLTFAQGVARFTDSVFNFLKTDITQPIKSFLQTAKELWQGLGRIASTLKDILYPALQKVWNGLKRVGNGIKSVFSGIGSKISGAASALSPFNKHLKLSNNLVSTFTKRISKMLINTYIFFQLRKAIRALFAQFKEGFTEYFKYDKKMGATVDTLKGKIHQFNNALAGALIPLLETILPYIIKIMDALTMATDKLSQFIAALSGKKTYVKAKAISETAEALDEVKESADAAKHSLASFDELEVQGSTSTTENQKTEDVKDYFETAAISNDILDFINKLSNALDPIFNKIRKKLSQMVDDLKKALKQVEVNFKKGDLEHLFTPLTVTIADWLNDIPWEDIYNKAEEIGKYFADVLNSVFEDKDLAEALGKTIAGFINTAASFIYGFLLEGQENDTFTKIGEWFATMINSAVANTDWNLLGTVIGLGINSAVDFAIGFLDTLDTVNLGAAIASMINRAVATIEWENIGTAIALIINKPVQGFDKFITDLDTVSFGKSVGKALQQAMNHIDWQAIGHALSESFNKASDLVLSFFDGYEEGSFGKGVGDAINSFFTNFDAGKLAQAISTFLGSIFTEISTLCTTIDWEQIGYDIAEFIVNLDIPTMLNKIGEAASALVGGIFTAIWTAIQTLIDKYTKDSPSDIHKALLALVTPVNLMLDLFKSPIHDIVDGIYKHFGYELDEKDWEELWTNIKDFWGDFWGNMLDAWQIGWKTACENIYHLVRGLLITIAEQAVDLASWIPGLGGFIDVKKAKQAIGDLAAMSFDMQMGKLKPPNPTPSTAIQNALMQTNQTTTERATDYIRNSLGYNDVNVTVTLEGDADEMFRVARQSAARQQKRQTQANRDIINKGITELTSVWGG